MTAAIVSGFEPVARGLYFEGLAVDTTRNVVWYSDVIAGGVHGRWADGRTQTEVAKVSLGYFGGPDDIAPTAIFLASDASNYVTGQTLGVDGGSTML